MAETLETRVGFMSTSALQKICEDYAVAWTKNNLFTGNTEYLAKLKNLIVYNNRGLYGREALVSGHP